MSRVLEHSIRRPQSLKVNKSLHQIQIRSLGFTGTAISAASPTVEGLEERWVSRRGAALEAVPALSYSPRALSGPRGARNPRQWLVREEHCGTLAGQIRLWRAVLLVLRVRASPWHLPRRARGQEESYLPIEFWLARLPL